MTGRVPLLLALLVLAGSANSQNGPSIRPSAVPPQRRSSATFRCRMSPRALAAKQLGILVIGTGSSSLPGPNGPNNAYPARLQSALAEKLPGVAVKVTTDVKTRAPPTNGENPGTALAAAKPA